MKILQLNYKDPNPEEWLDFYDNLLGFHCEEKDNSVLIELGYSTLVIEKTVDKRVPIHLAFHITPGSFLTTKDWIRPKVELLEHNESDTIEFSNWNARSFFFKDPMGNILEGIERPERPVAQHLLKNDGFIGIAEVGLSTVEFKRSKKELLQLGLEFYDEGHNGFAAMGNYEGLIILVEEGRPWFPSTTIAETSAFSLIWKDEHHEIHCGNFSGN